MTPHRRYILTVKVISSSTCFCNLFRAECGNKQVAPKWQGGELNIGRSKHMHYIDVIYIFCILWGFLLEFYVMATGVSVIVYALCLRKIEGHITGRDGWMDRAQASGLPADGEFDSLSQVKAYHLQNFWFSTLPCWVFYFYMYDRITTGGLISQWGSSIKFTWVCIITRCCYPFFYDLIWCQDVKFQQFSKLLKVNLGWVLPCDVHTNGRFYSAFSDNKLIGFMKSEITVNIYDMERHVFIYITIYTYRVNPL